MIDTIKEANHVLSAMRSDARFEKRSGRLWLVTKYGENAIVSGSTGWYPALNYGRHGMGGTQAGSVMQLAHWVRGKPRVPVSTWEYWCGPKIGLADRELIDRLKASSYGDPKMTACVLCGAAQVGDWWSKGKLVGPVCGWTTGCQQDPQANKGAAS